MNSSVVICNSMSHCLNDASMELTSSRIITSQLCNLSENAVSVQPPYVSRDD